jgi:cytochrome c oxidase subunit I
MTTALTEMTPSDSKSLEVACSAFYYTEVKLSYGDRPSLISLIQTGNRESLRRHDCAMWIKITELFSDRKAIGFQYVAAGVLFLIVGIVMTQMLRWHLSHPEAIQSNGSFYDSVSISHGTILVFFGIIPVAFAAVGNLCMPVGQRDRIPWVRLDAVGLLLFYVAATCLFISSIAPFGNFWLIALVFNFAAWLVCSFSFIRRVLIVTEGERKNLPLFIWSLLLTAALLFVDLLLLEFAALMQLLGSFNESTISVMNAQSKEPSLLWHHLFWFLGHPEVYVLMLFMFGLIAELMRLGVKKVSSR